MAYTVTQESVNLRGAYDDLVFVVYDTAYADPKYRYACSVTVSGATAAILLQLPNNANAAVFNIKNVVAQYVEQDENPYLNGTGSIDILSLNTSAYKTVTVRFGYSSAVSVDLAPTLTLLPATDKTPLLINGNFMLSTESEIQTSPASLYIPTTSNEGLFLSDMPHINGDNTTHNYVLDTGSLRSLSALSFINDTNAEGAYIGVRFYNGNTILSTTAFVNSIANGGYPPSTVTNDTQRLLYVGCGAANLEAQSLSTDMQPSDAANLGWTSYEIVLGSTATPFTDAVSERAVFHRVECNRFIDAEEFYTVHWWNSKGGVDSLIFGGKSIVRQSMVRNAFRQIGGNSFDADGSGTDYVRYSYEGGKTQSNVRTTTTLSLTTVQGNPEILAPLAMSLINSERVYITPTRDYGRNENRNTAGIENPVRGYIAQNSFVKKTSVNDKTVSYKVEIEVSRLRPSR